MAKDGSDCDVLLVGAGLANSLIALELDRRRPDLSVLMIEAASAEEAEAHTWCVFETDMSASSWRNLSPGFDQLWDGYEVAFPGYERKLTTAYGCLTSTTLARLLGARPNIRMRQGQVAEANGTHAVLADGQRLTAGAVIDGRGARPSVNIALGFQKFVGVEVQLRQPHGLSQPVVMDATVRQLDGYRFVYVLPLSDSRLLIEDTRYADGADLDVNELECDALRYGRARGWAINSIVRREQGVLPVALDGDPRAYFAEPGRRAPQVGMAGLFFHPTTGYSFPDATRVAELVACEIDLGGERLAVRLREHAIRLWEERSFYRLLNRMLFRAAEPEERYRVLERFYRLPQPLVERFYAGRTTLADKARVLSGKPPVPVWRALKAALPGKIKEHHAAA